MLLAERRGRWLAALSLALGCCVFFGWMGYGRTLAPTDLSWIFHEDPLTHEIGWEQFRNAPLLQYPITQNRLDGLELSSNIVFSDSIPIVGLVLRPFSALLPRPFQYLGLWILLSCVLQAYWGMRLVLLRTSSLPDAVLGAALFSISPVLIERVGGQTAVGSHWLLLWALWLYLSHSPGRGMRHGAWAVLLLLTVSVHAYLFVMVGTIWAAYVVACRMRGELGRRDAVACGATLVGVVAWMHALGYFMVGKGVAGGAWRSNADLLAFLEPAAGARQRLLPVIYNNPWDGSLYLGGGVIALAVVGSVVWWRGHRHSSMEAAGSARMPWTPLLVAILGLVMFALTEDVKLLGHRLILLPYPHGPLDRLYEAFRGAARMMWPAYYLTILAALWAALGARTAKLRTALLAGALVVQVFDLTPMAKLKHAELGSATLLEPLADPIWNVVGTHYERIIGVPAKNRQPHWPTFAWFATQHRMGTNIGYLSRVDSVAADSAMDRYIAATGTGRFDSGTVYYFPSPLIWNVARSVMRPDDLAVIADGFHLILPGGRKWSTQPAPTIPPAAAWTDRWIEFNSEESAGLLFSGWSWAESWGTWSLGGHSRMVLPVPPNERVRVTIRWAGARARTAHVTVGGQAFEVRFPAGSAERHSTFEVQTTGALLDITIDLPGVIVRPNNRRTVGVALYAARVQLASAPSSEAPSGEPVLDTWMSFATDGAGRPYLQDGWSFAEAWGTWSASDETTLAVPVPSGERIALAFRWVATGPPGQHQTGTLYLDGKAFEVRFPPEGASEERTFELTSTRRWVDVRLVIDHPVDAGGRLLGVGLQAVRVQRVATPLP